MIYFKIALRNAIKHRGSSLVLAVIIATAVFALYWIFGFSNTYTSSATERELFNNGHLSYETDFVSDGLLKNIAGKNQEIIEKIEGMRRIMAISASVKESGPMPVTDINARNEKVYKKYRLDCGRLPESEDEIVLSIEHKDSRLNIGESIFITTFTHDKIVNTMKYRVAGKGHIGGCSIITQTSMDKLVNSDKFFNNIIVYIKGEQNSSRLDSLDASIRKSLTDASIKIDSSTNYLTQMKEIEILNTVFRALKIIVFIILFPLLGAVLGAIVWVHSYKRRGELWTYSSIGFRDRQIYAIAAIEYLIVSFAGFLCGMLLGLVTSVISEAASGMLTFSYIIETMLVAKIYMQDFLIIFAFVTVNVVFWIRMPVGKIIKAKPFSY